MTASLPGYLRSVKAPVSTEINGTDLPVTGKLPAELSGRYVRNGPNPLPGSDRGHWFNGDGMLHGVRLRDGNAEWYRNRWVRTAFRDGERFVSPRGDFNLAAVPANTSVIRHAGKLFALVEAGLPYEITPELDTVGPCDFGGRLTTAMTAHPKLDPATGELHFFGYGIKPPFLTYHRLSADGDLVHSNAVAVPGPTMMHDFAITERYVVWLDLPVVFQPNMVGEGMPYEWSDTYGARIGVMSRHGGDVRWHDVDPSYVFHVGNAFEDPEGRIVLDAVRYSPLAFASIWPTAGGGLSSRRIGSGLGGRLHRWIVDVPKDSVTEVPLDDREIEFPTFHEARTGLPSRFLYTVGDTCIIKYDTERGTSVVRQIGAIPGEARFVAREGAAREDDGWLMSIVTDFAAEGSQLRVYDAMTLEPVASVALPRRVPLGFHGDWFPDS